MTPRHPQNQLNAWWKSEHTRGTFSLGPGEGRYHSLAQLAAKILQEDPAQIICYASPNQELAAQFRHITTTVLAKIIPADKAKEIVDAQVQVFTHSAIKANQKNLDARAALIILDGRAVDRLMPYANREQHTNPKLKIIASTELLGTDQILPALTGIDIMKTEFKIDHTPRPFDPFDL